jgi:hypothetical protein
MVRHLSRAAFALIFLSVALFCLPGQALAQVGNAFGQGGILNDPFTFYYAFYLPNQQIQALRPGPMDSINTAMMARQYYAQSDRRGLYNPISPYSEQNYDPLRPYSQQSGERMTRPFRFSIDPSNADGSGPSLYFNRAAAYFPHLREGRGGNANVATTRRGTGIASGGRRAGGGGYGGMGGMGMGGMGGMGTGGMGGMGGMGMGGMGMM